MEEQNMEEQNELGVKPTNDESFVEKKSHKGLVIGLVTIILILIACGGYFGYYYFYLNTEMYIDNLSNKLVKRVEKVNFGQGLDAENKDLQLAGNIDLKNNDTNLGNLVYDLKVNARQDVVNLKLGLEENQKSLISGNLYYQDHNLYADIDDVLNSVIDLGEILNEEQTAVLDEIPDVKPEDVKYIVTHLIEYYFTGLKEAKLETNLKGLTEKEYVVELDKITAKNANKKLAELIKEDKTMNKVLGSFDGDYDFYPTGKLIVTVKAYNNEVTKFALVNNNEKIEAKPDGEKYVLAKDDMKLHVWTDDTLKLEAYENDTLVLSMALTKDGYITLDVNVEDVSIKFETGSNGKDSTKVAMSISDAESINLSYDGVVTQNNNHEATVKGTLELASFGVNLKADLNVNILADNNLVEKINVNNAKKLDQLSEEEQLNLYAKLMEIMNKYDLGNI